MIPVIGRTKLLPFGSQIDIDLSKPLDAATRRFLQERLSEDALLVVRGQDLTPEDQIRFVGYFGAVLAPEREHAELALDGDFGRGRIAYHSDLIFTQAPYKRLSLYALDLDPDQTSTRFVSGVRAAAALPQPLRDSIAAMTAVSVVPFVQTHREIAYELPAGATCARHPVLFPHPGTGEPVLYVTEMQTARIEGLAPAASDALLAELFSYLYAPEQVLEHRWRPGDLVLWDNIALQHGRDDQAGVRVRRMRRVVGAELSFYDLCPEFTMGEAKIEEWGKSGRLRTGG
jgi:taurine dioxygenase